MTHNGATRKDDGKNQSKKQKEWTIMVYLAGDNNLSEEMITGLTGMKNAMSSPGADTKINLVAVYDSGYPTALTKHYSFTKKNSSGPLSECEIIYEHPQRRFRDRPAPSEKNYIIDFVRWSAEKWPAKNYALILSGHSDGFLGRTLFKDSNPSSALNLRSLRYILKRSQMKLGDGKKFRLLGFDSCLMSMAEVGYEFKDIAEWIVASEGNVPVSGWSYDQILPAVIDEMNSNKKFNGEDFGRLIVTKFLQYSRNYNIGGRSVNISACDVSQAADLREKINNLAAKFLRILNAPIEIKDPALAPTDLKASLVLAELHKSNAASIERLKSIIRDSHYYSQTFMYEQAVDLKDFAETVASNCDLALGEIGLLVGPRSRASVAVSLRNNLKSVKAACQRVSESADKYAKYSGACGAEYQFSSGVSIFFPWSLLALYMVYHRYDELTFAHRSDWFKFVKKFTQVSYRATGEPLYREGMDYLQWRKDVAIKNKDVSARDVSARDVSARDVSARNELDEFYNFFRRFRNHPINHDVFHVKPHGLV